MLSCVQLFATPCITLQAPMFVRLPRQEYWCRLPFPPPGDLPDPEIKPASPESPVLVGRFFTTEPPGKPLKGLALHNYSFPVLTPMLSL